MNDKFRRLFRCIPPAGALSIVCALGACNIVGPAYYFVSGPEKIAARYTLPEEMSTVVFVDDRRSVLPDRALRRRIATGCEKQLLEKKAVKDIIASQSIEAIASRDRFTKPQGIVEIGEAVGAQTVVYATIDSFALSTDGTTYQPTAALRVKVIDITTKQRVWPEEPEEWYTLSLTRPPKTKDIPQSESERMRAAQEFADRLGLELGNLFVKHEEVRDGKVSN
jgi:hypothetical protein